MPCDILQETQFNSQKKTSNNLFLKNQTDLAKNGQLVGYVTRQNFLTG